MRRVQQMYNPNTDPNPNPNPNPGPNANPNPNPNADPNPNPNPHDAVLMSLLQLALRVGALTPPVLHGGLPCAARGVIEGVATRS